MNRTPSLQITAAILAAVLVISSGACSNAAATLPAEPSLLPSPPTETLAAPTPSPSPIPATETATPRPTSVPGSTFEVQADGLKLELEVHACNMTNVGYGHFTTEGSFDDDVKSMMEFTMKSFKANEPPIVPNAGDDIMCWMKGKVLEGSLKKAQLSAWVDEDSVYLLDQAGVKSDLIYAGMTAGNQTFLTLFSAWYEFAPIQIQIVDTLADLP